MKVQREKKRAQKRVAKGADKRRSRMDKVEDPKEKEKKDQGNAQMMELLNKIAGKIE